MTTVRTAAWRGLLLVCAIAAAGAIDSAAAGARARAFRLEPRPRFWRPVPAAVLARALVPVARAQEDESVLKEAAEAVAQILFGVAAIIAAIAPMSVASTQASADVAIAGINAETQKQLTMVTASTSIYLADQQKDIALQQSRMAQEISARNNAGVTDRLEMQLVELRSARVDAQRAEAERRQIDQGYNQQRIALAEKQAGDNLRLAKATLNAQLTQAGLSQGFSGSVNSGDRLGVSRAGIASGAADQDFATGVARGAIALDAEDGRSALAPAGTRPRPGEGDRLALPPAADVAGAAARVARVLPSRGAARLDGAGALLSGLDEPEDDEMLAPRNVSRKRRSQRRGLGRNRRELPVRITAALLPQASGPRRDLLAAIARHSLVRGSLSAVRRRGPVTGEAMPSAAAIRDVTVSETTRGHDVPLSTH